MALKGVQKVSTATEQPKTETATTAAGATSTVTETKPAETATTEKVTEKTTKVGGKKKETTGNLILDIAAEVEQMSKPKALSEADKLAENIEINYFRMGGILKLINDNSWFEGFPKFDDFVTEKYGFAGRKARYLIEIYDNLVTKQIPWEKVQHLGWTKLKDLAKILTPENVDEWVSKAEKLTVIELQKLLKADEGGDGEKTAKTSDDLVRMTFKFKQDQADIVQQAIAKAKGELHTEFDTVALENIAAGYVGGVSAVNKEFDLDAVINATGFEPLLQRISELFPAYDITVAPATPVGAPA